MKLKNISYKEALGWLFIAISVMMLINSVRLCFSRDIWYDELFTIGMIEHSYGELIRFTAQDVHPPLYYCITKGIVDLCKLIIPAADTIITAKIVSVVPYFLLLVYALSFLRKKFGIFTAGMFTFCIVSMPQMSAYTVEIRMYGWALFFVTAAFFHTYEIIRDDECRIRHYAALTLYGLAAAYTQYFACVAIVMIYVSLLVWFFIRSQSFKKWAVCVAVSIIGYLPWLSALLSQITAVRENYWILPLTWRSLGGCVKFLMKPAFLTEWVNTAFAVIMFLLYLALLAVRAYRTYQIYQTGKRDEDKEAKWENFYYAASGCMVLCGLVAFGFLASVVVRPVFVYRYMIPAMGCFWFCFVLNIDALTDEKERGQKKTAWRQTVCMLALILVFIVGIRDYRAFMGEEEYKIVLMEETKQAISDIAKEDIIVYNFDQLQAVAGYYLTQENYLWNQAPERLIEEMFGDKKTVEDVSRIREWLSAGKKVWFFGSFNSREDIKAQWEADGLMVEETGSYMLERYWFNIYAVSGQR
ncbi:MAG: hypothetical protein NC231_04750 [Bacillus sp. (in: Bacteria)]|nr:hypothetical protein [Bacillus sp. (in: firmicutes)]MCM1426426.1 hypothetical protein [Eubacterium sp.]